MSLGHSTAARSFSRPQWRRLDTERRLQLVAQALRPSDGIVDHYPLAL
jgi:hypothetical protein